MPSQEDFAKAAALFARKPEVEAAEADMFADDGDDDMFADSDGEAGGKPAAKPAAAAATHPAAGPATAPSAPGQPAAGGAAGAAAAGGAQPGAAAGRDGMSHQPSRGAQVDYSSWPIKELRRFLQERGVVHLGTPNLLFCPVMPRKDSTKPPALLFPLS